MSAPDAVSDIRGPTDLFASMPPTMRSPTYSARMNLVVTSNGPQETAGNQKRMSIVLMLGFSTAAPQSRTVTNTSAGSYVSYSFSSRLSNFKSQCCISQASRSTRVDHSPCSIHPESLHSSNPSSRNQILCSTLYFRNMVQNHPSHIFNLTKPVHITATDCPGEHLEVQGAVDTHLTEQDLSIAYYNAVDNGRKGGVDYREHD